MTPILARSSWNFTRPSAYVSMSPELYISADVIDSNFAALDALPDKMEAHFNMVDPVMKERVLAQLNRGIVVHVNGSYVCFPPEQIAK